METAYPWTLQWYDDYPNQMWQLSQLHAGYDASVNGQRAFLEDLMAIVRNVPNGRGKGIFYWSPEWISVPGLGCDWENVALFDFNGVLLTSIDAFAPPNLARITLPLNAASLPDTVGSDAFFQVCGEVNGTAPDTLPDGNILDWTQSSNLILTHTGGDYFKASFAVASGSEIRFKFWSEDAEHLGLNGGWEIGDSNGDGFGNTVITVTADTTLPLHFFNGTGDRKPYDWRSWEPKEDTVAVWFRVYMNTEEGVSDGYDPSASNQVIGVRGDNLTGSGPLDWEATKVTLQRELEHEYSSGFHLFSGVCYYPISLVGQWQGYKFFIEPHGWEEGNLKGNRIFAIPGQDTTLHWVYYGDTSPIQEDTICVQGDVNCDRAINVVDVLAVVNHILGIEELDPEALVRADCNGDGVVNILDALAIVNVILGIGQED